MEAEHLRAHLWNLGAAPTEVWEFAYWWALRNGAAHNGSMDATKMRTLRAEMTDDELLGEWGRYTLERGVFDDT